MDFSPAHAVKDSEWIDRPSVTPLREMAVARQSRKGAGSPVS
jgi:hypothetical protein